MVEQASRTQSTSELPSELAREIIREQRGVNDMTLQEALDTINAAHDNITKLLNDTQFNHFLFEVDDEYQANIVVLIEAQAMANHFRKLLITATKLDSEDNTDE